jgi:hypothetical protein
MAHRQMNPIGVGVYVLVEEAFQMARYRLLVLLVVALMTVSCAPKAAPPPAPEKPAPGSKLQTSAEAVFTSLDCAKKPLPYLVFEHNSLTPNPARPGEELRHRLVYAFCPAPSGQAEAGTLTRALSYKGKVIFSDVTKDFPITPGRVAVDAYLAVPAEAEPGLYAYTLEYVSNTEVRKRKLARTLSFDEKIDLILAK